MTTLRSTVGRALRGLTAHEPQPRNQEVYAAYAEMLHRAHAPQHLPASVDLAPYEFRVFSQNGEDGVLAEILRRAGETNRTFIEFGGSSGLEANCVFLADVLGWTGLFIEPDAQSFSKLDGKYRHNARIRTVRGIVTPSNVEEIFNREGMPASPDVISIDIDGDDYWVWESITRYRPRVVVIEYNSVLGPDQALVQRKGDTSYTDRGIFLGASIGALMKLGAAKGYRLVHEDTTGVNAFFVREDIEGRWPEPGDVVHRSANYRFTGRQHPQADRRDYLSV